MFENPARFELLPATSTDIPAVDIPCCRSAASSAGRVLSAAPPVPQDIAQLPSMFREATKAVRAKYRHLYDLPVIEYPDGSRSFHDGRLYRRHGLNVLFLRGDSAEMAFQHGRLLADEIPLGAIPQTGKLVSSEVANALGGRSKFKDKCIDLVQRFIIRRMFALSNRRTTRDCGDSHTLVELIAISDATGMPMDDIVLGWLNPELLMVLSRLQYANAAQLCRIAGTIISPLSCSSFAAWGNATADGKLLVGHNMDYPLNGYFDRFPTVIYFEPPAPALRFMSFMSAGLHTAGITAYNEAGVFLATHIAPTTDVSLQGVPSIIAADSVIRRANSYESAGRLLRHLHPSAGWSYILASAREGKIGSIEASAGHTAIRPAEGEHHVQTNHYLTDAMRGFNLNINRSVDEDSEARFQRIDQRVKDATGRLDIHEAISILGDQVDPQVNEVRGLGNTVSVHLTMSSIVLDPAHDRVFVSSGAAPASHSDFVELPLIGTFDRDDFPDLPCPVISNKKVRESHPEKAAAQQTFIQAKVAYEMKNDSKLAYQLLKDVVRDDASNPAYFFQLGIFALKNEQHDEAIKAFDSIFSCPYSTEQLRRLAHYYRGRTLAHLGKNKEAQADLSVVAEDSKTEQKLRTAARRAAWRLRIFGRCRLSRRSLAIMMQQSDMLTY